MISAESVVTAVVIGVPMLVGLVCAVRAIGPRLGRWPRVAIVGLWLGAAGVFGLLVLLRVPPYPMLLIWCYAALCAHAITRRWAELRASDLGVRHGRA